MARWHDKTWLAEVSRGGARGIFGISRPGKDACKPEDPRIGVLNVRA